ncbi:MAG: phosphate ABC transporter permease subunit PstC [Chloroflexi bacterium]|nr:phosphate ABC transporter permease subunit PstC [Chloroflexota bacterium]
MSVSQRTLRKVNGPFAAFGRWLHHGDTPWRLLTFVMALCILLVVVAIGVSLWQQSRPAQVAFGWQFLAPTQDASWNPVLDKFEAWPSIYGTLVTSLIAVVLSVPVSISVAIFLTELCPAWLRTPLGLLIELLAAVPSVVYGLWGMFVFLPTVVTPIGQWLESALGTLPILDGLFSGPVPLSGLSRLGAGFILAIMILPTISAVSRDVLLAIPRAQREASLALGATQWETISQVLIPYGLSGILGAILLGLGRALGETMAVTMVIGNSLEPTSSLLRPGSTMASVIANEFAEAVSTLHSSALLEIGLILFAMTLLLNAIARLLVWSVARRIPQEACA